MCAIAGFNWKHEGKAAAMAADLSYRGPDATGVWSADGISLAHDRLAVIDLSSEANQPMRDASGELTIVFNGEIYNFQELKKELGQYSFRTKSDTEVILAGYRAWGERVVEKLNGMFAFAIWDARTKTLFCARDRAGMKPFYYYWAPSNPSGQEGKFIFASELKALFTHDIPRTLDRDAFNHYLRLLYVPSPRTLIQNVHVLPPAHTLTLRGTSLALTPYDVGRTTSYMGSYGDAVEELRGKVHAAVARHLVADVPLGVYLSGGIDSSVVLSAASSMRQGLKTFTIGFEGVEEEGKFNADFKLAQRTAAHFGTNHHPVIISPSDALSAFDEVAAHNSDPVSNPTSIAMYLLARHAKSEVTVVLTGNAGDELFGGYDRYRMALAASYYRKLPHLVQRLGSLHPKLAKLRYGSGSDLFARFMFQKDERLQGVISPRAWKDAGATKALFVRAMEGEDVVERLIEADRTSWLPDHFFMLSDHMSMASALEERMPLADSELLRFAHSLPRPYKVDLFRTKKVLKDAFRSELPAYLFTQPKRGWFSPAAKWLRDPAWNTYAHELLSADFYDGTRTLFNFDEAGTMLDRHISKEQYNLSFIWALMTFQAWAKHNRITA